MNFRTREQITNQLNHWSETLEDGWLWGVGIGLKGVDMTWAIDTLDAMTIEDASSVGIVPTDEGCILAEVEIGGPDSGLSIDVVLNPRDKIFDISYYDIND